MKKHPIGFLADFTDEPQNETVITRQQDEPVQPKKSIVQVYFPHRGMSLAYYNDSFDLKVGDLVYVEGKLEGYRGQITDVNYSFKIKLSDYKKVIYLIDTNVKGDIYLSDSHVVSFEKTVIPFSKILTWFKAPENEEDYIINNDDDENSFPLNDLTKMKISRYDAERGHEYYNENRVSFIEIDGTHGHAIIEGSKNYEIEFEYCEGEISNLKCSCFCSGTCRHEFAAMLQLKETLELITKNYEDLYNGYFAAISKRVFINTVMNRNISGKITLGI